MADVSRRHNGDVMELRHLEARRNNDDVTQTRRPTSCRKRASAAGLGALFTGLSVLVWCCVLLHRPTNATQFVKLTILLSVSIIVLVAGLFKAISGCTLNRFGSAVGLVSTAFTITVLAVIIVAMSSTSSVLLLSPFVTSVWSMEAILMLYVYVLPMHRVLPFWFRATVAVIFSVVVEVLLSTFGGQYLDRPNGRTAVSRVLLHVCVHLVGVNIGLAVYTRRQRASNLSELQQLLENERRKQTTIVSMLIPPQVAMRVVEEWSRSLAIDVKPLTWYEMNRHENVTILFADIAGFTAMSRTKTPSELVELLNDLYGRFDTVCRQKGVEKVGTLGDCYYCIAGYPTPVDDHALRLIQTGLAICNQINDFKRRRNEFGIDMRIGVHSGAVLCGVVGRKRFRFDIYSDDVTFASKLESTGAPGKLHLSDVTYQMIRDRYREVEQGAPLKIVEERQDRPAVYMPTWFISSENYISDAIDGVPELHRQPNPRNLFEDVTESTALCFVSSRFSTDRRSTKDLEDDCRQNYANNNNSNEDDNDQQFAVQNSPGRVIFSDQVVFVIFYVLVTVSNLTGYAPDSSQKPLLEFGLIGLAVILSALLTTITVAVSLKPSRYRSSTWRLLRKLQNCLPFLSRRDVPSVKHSLRRAIGTICVSVPSLTICFYALAADNVDVGWLTTLVAVTLLHNCNFSTLGATAKSFGASVCAVAAICILIPSLASETSFSDVINNTNSTGNWTSKIVITQRAASVLLSPVWNSVDVVLSLISVTLLVWIVNCTSEAVYRRWLLYQLTQRQIETGRAHTNWLLEVSVPDVVANQIRRLQTVDDVIGGNFFALNEFPNAAILFFKIVNFDDQYYEEQYREGAGCIGVLHRIVCRFDDLLSMRQYRNIEKIKMIGSCLMVASGVTISTDGNNRRADEVYRRTDAVFDNLHLLVQFGLEAAGVVQAFNNESFRDFNSSFRFTMKAGIDCGPVMAGVVGSSRLLFDVWGTR